MNVDDILDSPWRATLQLELERFPYAIVLSPVKRYNDGRFSHVDPLRLATV